MSVFHSLRSGLLALFSVSTTAANSSTGDSITIDDIRAAMLRMAGEYADAQSMLVRRIRYTADPQALWFMRSELMARIAHREGEAIARMKMEMLSDMFRELLPKGLRSRPSPLFAARESGQRTLSR